MGPNRPRPLTIATDVLVAGSGPGALAAALRAALHGLEVILIEGVGSAPPTPLAEALLPAALEALEAVGMLAAIRPLARRLDRVALTLPGGARSEARFPGADGQALALDRSQLIGLLKQAVRTQPGLTMLPRIEALDVFRQGSAVVGLVTSAGPVRARAVVFAEGPGSALGLRLGLRGPSPGSARIALCGQLHHPTAVLGRSLEVLIEAGLQHHLTPIGDHVLQILVLGTGPSLAARGFASPRVEEAMRRHPLLGPRLVGAHPEGPWLQLGPLSKDPGPAGVADILVVEDGMTHLDPLTGGGIGLALRQGIAAADALGQAACRGEEPLGRAGLSTYARAHARMARRSARRYSPETSGATWVLSELLEQPATSASPAPRPHCSRQ